MVWTISLEECLINGSILQGSKDLRLSNLIVKSEKNSIWIIPPWSSFRSQNTCYPPKNTCFELELLQPCSKKEDPVTLRQKGLETIAILSLDNFAIAYTDGSSDRSLSNGGAGIILLLPDGNNYKHKINTGIIASNFTSELVAIRETLILYQQNPHVIDSTEGLVIFSDSKSAIEAIKNGETNISCVIITLLEQLHNKRKSCILQWIPAHVNIEESPASVIDREISVFPLQFPEKFTGSRQKGTPSPKIVGKVTKLIAFTKLVAKNNANLALSPRFRQGPIELPL
ncbi:RNase H domain-containing protein [Trichonephila clavipes]|nr:RNase H domain-containing protein [Trichonephila clavipes]